MTGAQFAPYSNFFFVGVFGDYVNTSTIGEGPSIIEQVGPNRYVAFNGQAGLSVGPGGASTISAPFKGTIEYCELKSAIGQSYDCSEALATVRPGMHVGQRATDDDASMTRSRSAQVQLSGTLLTFQFADPGEEPA